MSLDSFDRQMQVTRQHLEMLLQLFELSARQQLSVEGLNPVSTNLEALHIELEKFYIVLEKLQLGRQYYQELFDFAPDAYLVTTPEGIILQANHAAATLLNLERQLLMGKRLAGLMTDQGRRAFYALLTYLRQCDRIQGVELALQPYGKPSIYTALDITTARNHKNQMVELRWLLRDITEQRRVVAELKKSESHYRTIVETQTELVWRTSADGMLIFINPACSQYFSKSPEELIGQSFFDWIPEMDRIRVMQRLASLCQETPAATIIHRMILTNGEVRWQHWNYQALFDPQGCFLTLQGVGRDITFECPSIVKS